jgi:hypothetical protein
MSHQQGSVLTGEQIVFSGPIEVNETTDADGPPDWSVEFVSEGPEMETDGELTLNLSDGRSGQMFVARNEGIADGRTTVICRGVGRLS